MAQTALTLIKSALRKIGVLGVGQSLSAEEAQEALDALNQMLSSWSVEGYNIYTQTRESFPLTANVASYTIGAGQTFNTTRPVYLTNAFVRYATGTTLDNPLALIDNVEYGNIENKALTGIPSALYYDGNYPNATLILWPVPNAQMTLHLYSYKELTSFATLNTSLDLPPSMARALSYNLAVEMAPEYERDPNATVMRIAKQAKRNLKVANSRNLYDEVVIDQALLKRRYFDIYSGRFI